MSGSFPALPQIQPFQAPNLMALSNAMQEQSMNAMRERQLFGAEQEKNALRRYLADPTLDLTSPDAARNLLVIAPTTGAATYQALLRGYADKRAAEASVRAGTASSAAAAASARQAEYTNLNIQKANFDLAQRSLVGIGNLPDEEKPAAWAAWRAETEKAVPWTRGRIPRDYSPAAYRDALLTAQGVAERITAEARPPADYTLNNTRYSGATNQPIAAAEVRDTAREARIRSIMETQNVPLPIAAGIVDGVLVPITDPVTGQTRMFNKANNTFLESTPAPATPPVVAPPAPAPLVAGPRTNIPPPTPPAAEVAPAAAPAAPTVAVPTDSAQPQRTLYQLADTPRTTGLIPMLADVAQGVTGQVGINLPGAADLIERRQMFSTAQGGLIRALSVNPRYPVGEMERIREEINISPGAFIDPVKLKARLRSVGNDLRVRLSNEERAANDTSLPPEQRRNAAAAVTDIRNFLAVLGAPERNEPPPPSPRAAANRPSSPPASNVRPGEIRTPGGFILRPIQ